MSPSDLAGVAWWHPFAYCCCWFVCNLDLKTITACVAKNVRIVAEPLAKQQQKNWGVNNRGYKRSHVSWHEEGSHILHLSLLDLFMHTVVLTSHFASEKNGESEPTLHYMEIEVALMANMLNPALLEVHVLYESFGQDNCSQLRQRLIEGMKPHTPVANLTCVDVKHQPTYYGSYISGLSYEKIHINIALVIFMMLKSISFTPIAFFLCMPFPYVAWFVHGRHVSLRLHRINPKISRWCRRSWQRRWRHGHHNISALVHTDRCCNNPICDREYRGIGQRQRSLSSARILETGVSLPLPKCDWPETLSSQSTPELAVLQHTGRRA